MTKSHFEVIAIALRSGIGKQRGGVKVGWVRSHLGPKTKVVRNLNLKF